MKLNKENEHLMACITLGYAKNKCYDKNRKKVSELTKWYRQKGSALH